MKYSFAGLKPIKVQVVNDLIPNLEVSYMSDLLFYDHSLPWFKTGNGQFKKIENPDLLLKSIKTRSNVEQAAIPT